MSSGEKAKPSATFEERNPFDISRNSGPEVAAEIAKRMAAWKQARARTNPAPRTNQPTTNQPTTNQSGALPSGDAKQPPIAVPVQPVRMPKAAHGSQPAQTPTGSAGSAAPRVPYFAVSATRRAMPPAPSPKQARPPTSRSDERAARTDEPAIMPSAPVREPAPQDQDKRQTADATILATTPEPPATQSSPAASAAVEEAPLEARAVSAPARPELSDSQRFESASAAEASEPTAPEPDETERRRAEARALKARWIAARDLDSLLERPAASGAAGVAQPVEAAETASRDAGIVSAGGTGTGKDAGPLVREPQGAEENLVRSATEEPDAASEPETAFEATARVDEPALPATPMIERDLKPEATAVQTSPIAARDESAGRKEPTFETPKAPASETTSVADRDAGQEALNIAALDEIAGRREPTFDTPVARAAAKTLDATCDAASEAGGAARDEMVAPPRAEPVAAEVRDPTTGSRNETDDRRALSIAALDAVAGRKEPTFDQPIQPTAADGAVADATTEAPAPIVPAEPAPTLSAPVEAANEPPARAIDALEEAAGRKDPTFDQPVRPAVAAPAADAAQKAASHIRLRPIETRIEARRVDTLRADPPLTARRPIFPHIELEEWDMPVAAARAGRERRGTGWAIGLGSLLLIAGITAPAAIWQQGRQAQDQVAVVTPPPATQQTEATPGSSATGVTTAQTPAQPTQAALPTAPQPDAPETPAVAAQQSSAPAPVAPKPEAPDADAEAPPATTLSAIGGGDHVNEAPVVAPRPPMETLKTASTVAPMVVRPFVPEQGNGPFLRAPTTGSASVPVAGADAKPRLMGQLKPKPAAMASASKPVASKPVQRKPKPFFQQSPDQMFETLIETLSEGKPVNPATKPTSPSSRR